MTTNEKLITKHRYDSGPHLIWWRNIDISKKFELLKKYGYQDKKKPWKYRALTNKGIFLIYKREQNG